MAENTQTQPKRQRGEAIEEEEEASKRHKYSYNHLMSILEEEEEEDNDKPVQDLSAILTALQQELCSPSSSSSPATAAGEAEPPAGVTASSEEDENGDRFSVIRHLLEASDDELGIPAGGGVDGAGAGEDLPAISLSDGLWELEDESANYYSLLHSQLFMHRSLDRNRASNHAHSSSSSSPSPPAAFLAAAFWFFRFTLPGRPPPNGLSLETAFKEIFHSESKDIIELVLALVQQPIPVHSPKEGITLKNTAWILLIKSQKHSCIIPDTAQSILNSPKFPLAPKPIFTNKLQLSIQTLFLIWTISPINYLKTNGVQHNVAINVQHLAAKHNDIDRDLSVHIERKRVRRAKKLTVAVKGNVHHVRLPRSAEMQRTIAGGKARVSAEERSFSVH
nr:uncharacterized protein LOC109166109 [Ipomoea batatas]